MGRYKKIFVYNRHINYGNGRNNSHDRNRKKKSYCIIYFKTIRCYNNNFRNRKSYIVIFSFNLPCFFKAILFMCAGIIIHNIKDYQDIRKIGYRFFNMHFSISIIIIANISLCGLPFISGFYSKDFIIEIILIKGKNLFFLFLIIFGTILTVIYSCRLNFLVSINFIKSECYYFINENSLFILIGIMFLLSFSILGGIIISSNKIIYIPL